MHIIKEITTSVPIYFNIKKVIENLVVTKVNLPNKTLKCERIINKKVQKYKRFERQKQKFLVHIPNEIFVKTTDIINIGYVGRQISKLKSHVLIKINERII